MTVIRHLRINIGARVPCFSLAFKRPNTCHLRDIQVFTLFSSDRNAVAHMTSLELVSSAVQQMFYSRIYFLAPSELHMDIR